MTAVRPNILATRDEDGTVALWDLANTKAPMSVFRNIPNVYENANVEFRYIGDGILKTHSD
jgi:hypothetical protein